MGQDLIHVGGQSIQLSTPSSLTAEVLQAVVVPMATRGAEILLRTISTLRRISVEIDRERQARIAYLDEYSRVLRTDIIPALALVRAHQDGRSAGYSAGLDPDLLSDYLSDIERKRQQRRGWL